MTIGTEYLGYRQHDGRRHSPFPECRAQGRPHLPMPGAHGHDRREGVGAGDPGGGTSAPVRPVTWREAIDPGLASGQIELGWIFQVTQPPLIHLLGDPAFMPDVRMAAALVERGEYALYLALLDRRVFRPRLQHC